MNRFLVVVVGAGDGGGGGGGKRCFSHFSGGTWIEEPLTKYCSSKLVHVLLLHMLVILICKFLIFSQQDPVDNSILY